MSLSFIVFKKRRRGGGRLMPPPQSRDDQKKPSLNRVNNYKILIKDTEKIEGHIAFQNNRIDRHIKKWKSVILNIN